MLYLTTIKIILIFLELVLVLYLTTNQSILKYVCLFTHADINFFFKGMKFTTVLFVYKMMNYIFLFMNFLWLLLRKSVTDFATVAEIISPTIV